MNTNYVLVAVVVVLVLLAGAAFFWGGFGAPGTPATSAPIGGTQTQTSTSGSIPGNVNGAPGVNVQTQGVVTFTDNGFTPSTLTVKKGTAVVFVNNSSSSFWPASAPHPVHNAYPTTGGCVGSTFDACQAIGPGGRWSFTFDIAGTWKYHDHLNPSFFGTIVVQ